MAGDLFLHGGERNQDDVILVVAHGSGCSFGSEHAGHTEWQVVDADGLANRVRRAEKVLANGFSDHGNVGRHLDVILREGRALHKRPAPNVEILRLGAIQACGPIIVAKDNLPAGTAAGGGGMGSWAFTQYCEHVIVDQALGRAPAHVHAAPGDRSGAYKQQVRAHGLNLLLHRLPGALPYSQHSDDRPHADDDAQHGQDGTHLIAGQGPHRDADDGKQIHNSVSPLRSVF